MKIYDAHQDIAANIQLVTNKNFFKENKINDCFIKSSYNCVNQVDYPRLAKGNVRLIFATIFAKTKKQALEQLNIYHKILSKSKNIIPILSSKDLIYLKDDQIGFLFNMEGATPLEDAKDLDVFYEMGLRSIGISWRGENKYIKNGKLSKIGLRLLNNIENKEMILDAAHMDESLFWDVLGNYEKPFIVSHTACKSIYQNERNLSDEQIKKIEKIGGLIGIAGVNKLVGGKSIDDIIKNINHVIEQSSISTVCFGSDFDGMVNPKLSLIENFEDVASYPNLITKLNTIFKKNEVEKIAYRNLHNFILKILKKQL
ncbi:membrane dipeptidase [Patescibacteria group bacterium]|nr:membrane dipeptidase [Patescibacteria group bacterium]MBU1663166.1 membrane dipeptidase [Patescibacteria group bacterium]MBU1934262.1 membrane dipeptidase [Patescibacteria group bacterium]MBU2007693.1 membrane dipeptidase [Patescibacteria group bacterium]MBU2233843.1 membrane dipeptidase [Patescibacteria group bacterium]